VYIISSNLNSLRQVAPLDTTQRHGLPYRAGETFKSTKTAAMNAPPQRRYVFARHIITAKHSTDLHSFQHGHHVRTLALQEPCCATRGRPGLIPARPQRPPPRRRGDTRTTHSGHALEAPPRTARRRSSPGRTPIPSLHVKHALFLTQAHRRKELASRRRLPLPAHLRL